jgi:hypothetical protein
VIGAELTDYFLIEVAQLGHLSASP